MMAMIRGWLHGRPHILNDDSTSARITGDKTLIGIHAQRLINDPVLGLAFEAIERDLTATWRNSALGHGAQREEAYRLVWALAQVRTKLNELLADKKMLEAEQKAKEARDERERERRAA